VPPIWGGNGAIKIFIITPPDGFIPDFVALCIYFYNPIVIATAIATFIDLTFIPCSIRRRIACQKIAPVRGGDGTLKLVIPTHPNGFIPDFIAIAINFYYPVVFLTFTVLTFIA
jgi:hypothetical protein